MPAKKAQKVAVIENVADGKPLPPNIFLYIQLARIDTVPGIIDPLEIHLEQGGSLIIKCVEQYNTDGVIDQDEFTLKPTYTLVMQQDNLDRINHAADNPLLIKLYMRKFEEPNFYDEEEMELEMETSDLLNMLFDQIEKKPINADVADDEYPSYKGPKFELILLSVGYLDIVKLLGHHRCMLREQLFLYPVPECPMELRRTVSTEWHLYTLVPIAKEITFTNMAFITFESIYNLKEEYTLDLNTLNVQLSFRSMLPIDRNEYHVIPWCSFNKFTETCIERQNIHHVFEYFRNSVPNSNCTGLNSSMDLQMHRLFAQLMRSEHLEADFGLINTYEENALVCNTFHRFILTNNMSEKLFMMVALRRYVIAVDVWNTAEIEKKVGKKTIKQLGNQKIFTGILDPAILIFPGVQSIRFAVDLKYLGHRKKPPKVKAASIMTSKSLRLSNSNDNDKPTFCIIKICLLAPLGEIYQELKVFRESFISQNRLLCCKNITKENQPPPLSQLQREAYARFDMFMRATIRYIVDKNVYSVDEKKGHFCCALQNLTNILLKLIGCDFNMREHTTTNVEFANLCAVAYNELEVRVHKQLEKIEEEGLDDLIVDKNEKNEELIDYMNAIKLMNAVGDTRLADYFYQKEKSNGFCQLFDFYDQILKMERCDYVNAKKIIKSNQMQPSGYEYFGGWIGIYLDYIATRDDPDPVISANANECLLNSIMQYSDINSRHPDGWILLYCYYKRFNYAPGFNYACWRLEGSLKGTRDKVSSAPYSLWCISLNMVPTFSRQRNQVFFDSFKMFVRLGLYEFGQVIFDDIQHECSKAESYMISAQLKILLNQLDEDFEVTTFTFEEHNADELAAFNAQLNGNVEYYRGNMEAAAEYYALNLECSQTPTGRDSFLLSKLRLAYISYDAGNYQLTIKALTQPSSGKLLSLVSSYLMGKAYYRLEELNKALECFSNCTTFNAHVPNIWGFLALINLQMGNNLNAISCWKYARVDPTKTITDDAIFAELQLIDVDTVDLYIDMPSPWNSTTSIVDEGDE